MSRPKLALVIGAAVVVVAACSSSKSSSNHRAAPNSTSRVQTSISAATPPSSASASSSSASASVLSGTWHGQYGGGYSGTFALTWQQSGANLSGTIALSAPAETVPIHGSVSRGTINFGTVGSYAITYTGSVSANSMSGNYQVAGAAAGGGTWSASKA